MFKIKSIQAREVLDSRGNPTIEVKLITQQGIFLDSVPSGASKGRHEAKELRDKDGGVKKAVENINKIIAPALKRENTLEQKRVDKILIQLDGTKNKSKLGANSILSVSMAICRAGAKAGNFPLYQHINKTYRGRASVSFTEAGPLLVLPRPAFNIINGGAHAGNELDFQEFMIVPQGKSFSENLRVGKEIYRKLKQSLLRKYGKKVSELGDEGGFAPPIKFPEEAIELILEAAKKLNYEIKIILDVAASQFFKKGKYKMKIGVFTKEGLLRYYEKLLKNYPIMGIEDPFSEEDLRGFKKITQKLGKKIIIAGDDLTVTNPERIKLARKQRLCNGIIIKPNQIGTISETLEAAKLARSFGWKIIISHRSGETCDDFIADLAVGVRADFIKAGAPGPKERLVKYNRLLEIEEEIRSAV